MPLIPPFVEKLCSIRIMTTADFLKISTDGKRFHIPTAYKPTSRRSGPPDSHSWFSYNNSLVWFHAKGTAHSDSDLDLLVIEESDRPRYERSGRYRRVLCGVFPAKDIVVWTPQQFKEWKAVPNAFISTVLAEGTLLYAS